MAETPEERKVRIVIDAQQPNASIKEMSAGLGVLNNQLAKMAADDPGRAKLQDDYARLNQRLQETRTQMRTVIQTEEELAEAQRKLVAENREVMLNGQKVEATFNEMKRAAQQLERELHDLSGDDPNRAKMLVDYQALQGRIEGVKKELGGAASNSGFFKQSMASALGVLTGGGVLELAGKAFEFLGGAKEDFEASAQAGAQLEATLKSTANSAGIAKEEIEALATARMGVTLFDDDDTKASASLLLTFTNIKNGVFQEAMPAIQDLAQKMAGDGPADLKGASIQVGKALNDPIKGITALSRVGVSFSEEQKKVIEQLVATGDVAGAQRIILGELNKEFGGSAEAARKAAGPLGTLKMQFADTKETIGGFVVDGLSRATDWLGRLWERTQPVRDIFAELWEEGTQLYATFYDIAESLGLVSDKGDSVGLVANLLIGLFTILLAPLRTSVALWNAMADSFVALYNKSSLFRGVVSGFVQVFKDVGQAAWDSLKGVGNLLVGIFTLDTEKIKQGLKQTFDGLGETAYRGGVGAAESFYNGYVSSKDKRIVRKVRVEAATETSTGGGAMPATTGEDEGADSLQAAAAAKVDKAAAAAARAQAAAHKKEQAAQSKADQARLDAIKKWVAEEGALLDSRLVLREQLAGRELSDEMQRREMQRQKLFDEADKKVAGLTGKEQNYTERVRAIVEERDRSLRELQAKFDEETTKRQQEQMEKKLAQGQADDAVRLAELELKLANGVLDEQAYQDAVHAVKVAAMERELEFARQKYGEGSTEYKKALADKISQDAEYAGKKRKLEDEQSKFEQALAFAKKAISAADVATLGEVLGKKNVLYKAAQAAQKAIAIAEIGMSLPKQWAANAEAGAKISAMAPPVTVPLGVAYTFGANALATAGAAAATAKIMGFREGGRTLATNGKNLLDMNRMTVAPNGKLLDQDGFAVAGVVHENEYVIPEWMRADPKVVQIEQFLEAKRLRGYIEGGATSDDVTVPPTGTVAAPETQVQLQLLEVLSRLDSRLADVEQWRRNLQVVQHTGELINDIDYTKAVIQSAEIR